MRSWSLLAKINIAVVVLVLVAVGVGGSALLALSSYNQTVEAMDRASRRAISGEHLNSLVLAAVMDSRGIYMSETVEEADHFAQPLLATLDELSAAAAKWADMAPADRRAAYEQQRDRAC